MAVRLQLRQGTTTEHNDFTGAVGEVTVDTTKDVLVVHDGVTVGGFPAAARANANGTISLIKKDGTSAGEINSAGLFNDTLTSEATDQALTANQGRLLRTWLFAKNGYSYTTTGNLNVLTLNSAPSPMFLTVTATIATAGTTLQIQDEGGAILGWSNSTVAGGRVQVCAVVRAFQYYSLVPAGTGAVTINSKSMVW
jgi:hypothetical protein